MPQLPRQEGGSQGLAAFSKQDCRQLEVKAAWLCPCWAGDCPGIGPAEDTPGCLPSEG